MSKIQIVFSKDDGTVLEILNVPLHQEAAWARGDHDPLRLTHMISNLISMKLDTVEED